MRAARLFAESLQTERLLSQTRRIRIDVFGSLGATGVGHGSGPAVILGLEGEQPDQIDPAAIPRRLVQIKDAKELLLLGRFPISFNEERDLVFQTRFLPFHPNGMQFRAFDAHDNELQCKTYYSIGGGLVVEENGQAVTRQAGPYPFFSAAQLLSICHEHNMSISEVAMHNESTWHTEADVRKDLLQIWQVMQSCVKRGLHEDGVLPGGLNVPRRAPTLYRKLTGSPEAALRDPLSIIDWVNLYALAVNEENASGGRVVTAPTNGAAGIIPAVLHYWTRFIAASEAEIEEGVVQIPCIERNAMASIKAINAARIALLGEGRHFVSLDRVIKTMRDTGADMNSKYKETSRGGLAVNVIVC